MDWGIGRFLTFILIFIIVILVIVFNVSKLVNNIGDSSNNNNNNTNHNSGSETSDTPTSYSELESNVESAAKSYAAKYYPNMLSGDNFVIKVSSLISDGDISKVNDIESKSSACTGYVVIYNNGSAITYDAYLDCKNYKTTGYDERYLQEY